MPFWVTVEREANKRETRGVIEKKEPCPIHMTIEGRVKDYVYECFE